MTSHQGQLQALITEMEALLGRAAPKLPWLVSGEASEQRRVMEQVLAYLQEQQGMTVPTASWGLATRQDETRALDALDASDTTAAQSQQKLQALLQEMQYLRAQMVQPLTREVIALQQQRETLKNEVRQLQQERLQQQEATLAYQPPPDWINDLVEQLRAAVLDELAQPLRRLQSSTLEDLTLSGAANQNLLMDAEGLSQLTPQQRLAQLQQVQSQTDGLLLQLDANLRAVFESLNQSIQSYCDTLNQGLDAMHGLGQQGEFIFRTFINHLAEQLQEEGSELAQKLVASQQELARLQGQTDDADTDDISFERDEVMNVIVDLDEVELNELGEFELDADVDLEEEVTLFQLDEDFDDWSDESTDSGDISSVPDRDEGEPTIIQTEPVDWAIATGQSVETPTDAEVDNDEPTIAYTEEIDALYDNLFGPAEVAPSTTSPDPHNEVDAVVDEQLLNPDLPAVTAPSPAPEASAATASASETAAVEPTADTSDTSLDFDFLLEADTPTIDDAAAEAAPPTLEILLGVEMAAELSPDEATVTADSDTITSLAELLPESDPAQALRPTDPFAAFDETADQFISAPPDENLLETDREVARTQVDLTLDDETFGILSLDLSQFEEGTPEAASDAPQSIETPEDEWNLIAPDLTLEEPSASLEAASPAPLSESIETTISDDQALPLDVAIPVEFDAAANELDTVPDKAEPPASSDADLNDLTGLFANAAPEADPTPTSAEQLAQAPLPLNSEPTPLNTDTAAGSADEFDVSAALGTLGDASALTSEPSEPSEAAAIAPPAAELQIDELFASEADDEGNSSSPNRSLPNITEDAEDTEALALDLSAAALSSGPEDTDILPRLNLDELELFDESALNQTEENIESPTNLVSEPTAATPSIDDVFDASLPDPGAAAPPSEPSAASESLSAETFWGEPSPPSSTAAENAETESSLTSEAAEPSLTFDELDFQVAASDQADSSFDLTSSTDHTASNLTLETNLFGDDTETDEAASDAESFDFEELDLNFSLEATANAPETQTADDPASIADSGLSELSDMVLPTLTESTDLDLAETLDDLELPPDSSSPAINDTVAPALAIIATTDDSLQLVADAPNDALMKSLADLPEHDGGSEPSVLPTAPTASLLDGSAPQPMATIPDNIIVSGSSEGGYGISFVDTNPETEVDQAVTNVTNKMAAMAEPADAEASNQLQQAYGQQLTSLTEMVAATSLPFTAMIDLSNLPEPDLPIAPTEGISDGGNQLEPSPLYESSLSLTGSVDEGFAIALPETKQVLAEQLTNLPDADNTVSDREPSTATDEELPVETSGPLTQEELATLFPLGDADDESVRDRPADINNEVSPRATSDDANFAELFSPDADPLEPEIAAADLSLEATDATALSEMTALDDESELSQTLAALDLSMEEIPEAEIALDEAFQTAFEDIDRLSDDAIADLDALTTDSAFTPAARESEPLEAPVSEFAETDLTSNLTDDETILPSTHTLATLEEDTPAPATPAAEDIAAATEEWFLGIDLGTTGLSAVLMEHHSGSAHPLCWVSETLSAEDTAHFRLPTIATIAATTPETDANFELVAIGPAAIAQPAEIVGQHRLHTLRPLLRVGIPHRRVDGTVAPQVQWSGLHALSLQQVLSAVTNLLQLVVDPAAVGLQLTAIGLDATSLDAALAHLQGVVMGLPTNWSDTYCFNMREAVLAAGLIESPNQVFFVEEAIAGILSGLPDPNTLPSTPNRSTQTLYQCHWQGGTVVISSGAACTEVSIANLPQPLDAVSREDFHLRNLAYGGEALDLDIICQLLVPPERRQPLSPGRRRPSRQGWGWQATLPAVANAQWADLDLEALDLPQLAEPDIAARQQLRQQLDRSQLGQSLLEAAHHLKLILQNQNHYQLELADQSWRVLRRDLESRVLVPYIQRINQQVNALLSETGLASQGINQVICTGGNASFNTIAKWLRQKFPNATIIQDTYPSDRPQTCSRVAYGLVNLCRYPQMLDASRHQYSDYFLLREMMRVMPDAPLPWDGILHLLEAQGINVQACQSRITAILEGHLPPGLLPDLTTRSLLSPETVMSKTNQDLAATSLFSQQTRNIYMVNTIQRDRLWAYLETVMQDKHQSLTEPLIAQLVAV